MKTKNRNQPRKLVCVVCVAALAGCAGNPMVRWPAPKSSEVPNYTLDYAKTYAHAARRAYQEAIDRQVALTTDLSTALIGLGGVLAALAAFKAHRDTLIGGALLGGTAYAIGNWNSSKPRTLIYQAGVEGTNCALRAISPLDMSDSDLARLNQALGDIETRVPQVQAAVARTRSALAKAVDAGLPEGEVNKANAAMEDAERGVVAANAVLVAGRQLAIKVRRAGMELINTVDRISAAVNKATLDTLPDLSAVPKVIAGLAGFAGSLIPGAGVEDMLSKAQASYKPTPQGLSGKKPKDMAVISENILTELYSALAELSMQNRELASVTARVRSYVAGYDGGASVDALKDCGVAEISIALRVVPDKVTFSGGADETSNVFVSGGIKPYVANIQQTPADGLTVRNPAPFDSTIQVSVSKSVTAPKSFSVIVMDSSNPARSVTIPITVGTAKEQPVKPPANQAAPTIEDLAAAVMNKASFSFSGTTLTVTSSAPNAAKTEFTVALKCDPNPAKPLDRAAVRNYILQETPGGASLGVNNPADKDKMKLTSTPPECLSPAPNPQGLGGKKKSAAKPTQPKQPSAAK